MKRILIVGVSSFVGSNLAIYLRKFYTVYGTYFSYVPRLDGITMFHFPIEKTSPIESLVRKMEADVIIYCAAESNEAKCMADPTRIVFLNAEAPSIFARAQETSRGKFIYLSTSKVFSGERGCYSETDPPDSVSFYGKSKVRAEEMLGMYNHVCVVRLGTIFGLGSLRQNSMLSRILMQLWNHEEIRLIQDEYRSFVSTSTLCAAMGNLVDADLEHASVYHVGTSEKNSYYNFGQLLASHFGIPLGKIKPISAEEFSRNEGQTGHRGNDLTLNSDFYARVFRFQYPTLNESILALKEALLQGRQ